MYDMNKYLDLINGPLKDFDTYVQKIQTFQEFLFVFFLLNNQLSAQFPKYQGLFDSLLERLKGFNLADIRNDSDEHLAWANFLELTVLYANDQGTLFDKPRMSREQYVAVWAVIQNLELKRTGGEYHHEMGTYKAYYMLNYFMNIEIDDTKPEDLLDVEFFFENSGNFDKLYEGDENLKYCPKQEMIDELAKTFIKYARKAYPRSNQNALSLEITMKLVNRFILSNSLKTALLEKFESKYSF